MLLRREDEGSALQTKGNGSSKLLLKLTVVLGVAAAAILLLVHGLQKRSHQFVLVVDAGSSGTRMHIFKFGNTDHLVLSGDTMLKSEPGLTALGNKLSRVSAAVLLLIREAERVIGKISKNTPLLIYATAGLRMLPKKNRNLILASIRSSVLKYFPFSNFLEVGILSGREEGIFAWLSISFLFQQSKIPVSNLTILELGGASLQIVFPCTSSSESLLITDGNKSKVALCQKSFLGLGIRKAKETFQKLELTSTCVESYGQCLDAIQRSLFGSISMPLTKIPLHSTTVLFSVFFDRLTSTKVIDPTDNSCNLEEIFLLVKENCNSPDWEGCFEFSYVYAILSAIVATDPKQKFLLRKKISNIETGWPLGAALHWMQQQHQFN